MDKRFVISSKKCKSGTTVVTLRLANELVEKVDSICERTGRTRNEIISLGLDFALDNIEIED